MRLNRFIAPLIAGLAAVGACDAGEEPGADDIPATDSVEAMAPAPGALTPINRSGVRGTAEAVRDGDGLAVEVEAEGMDPGARYTVILHEGRCADGGPVRSPVGRLVADEDGTGSLRTTVEPDRVSADAEFFIQIHAPDDSPVACANTGPTE